MGRWLEKLANMPDAIVTKPTELSFVSSVTSHLELTQKNSLIVMMFVRQCSIGMNAHPQEIIDCLLAVADGYDIINDLLLADTLRLILIYGLLREKPIIQANNLHSFMSVVFFAISAPIFAIILTRYNCRSPVKYRENTGKGQFQWQHLNLAYQVIQRANRKVH